MFRLVVPLQRKSLSSRLYHVTPALTPRRRYNPKEWRFIEASSGGVDLIFEKKGTLLETTDFTPEGMSAAEILAIPGAEKYFYSMEDAEGYIEQMANEKAEAILDEVMSRGKGV